MKSYVECYMRGHECFGVNISGNKFRSPKNQYIEYIKKMDKATFEIIEKWIDERVMPYMTRKSVNYNSFNSYILKHIAERELGFYVSNETIKYLLAIKGIKGRNTYDHYEYPLNLYYPLSSKFS